MKKIFLTLFAAVLCLNVIAQDNAKKTKPKARTQAEKDKKIVTTKEKRDVKPKGKDGAVKAE